MVEEDIYCESFNNTCKSVISYLTKLKVNAEILIETSGGEYAFLYGEKNAYEQMIEGIKSIMNK